MKGFFAGLAPLMARFVKFLVGFGPLGVFALAVIDGIGVPLPGGVDFLVVLLAAQRPGEAYLFAGVTIIGSLIGGMALYYAARKGGEGFLLKYTSEGRGHKLKLWFIEYGLLTVFIPALVVIPMPLKISEICAGALGVRPLPFFLTLLAARIPRYIGLAYLGAQMGEEGAWPWVKSHGWHFAVFSVALFVLLYLMILVVHGRRKEVQD